MRLSKQLVRVLWIGLTLRVLCEGKSFASKQTVADLEGKNAILTGKELLSEKFYKTPKTTPFQVKNKADHEDSISEEALQDESDTPEGGAESVEDDDEGDDGNESDGGENGKSDPSADFDDADFALEAMSEGAFRSIKTPGGESYVPCFGMWWPVNGGIGYDYYTYGDYGGGDYSTDDGGDYTDGRRRKRKRARRMRSRKKAAKRRRKRRRNKTA